MRPLLPGFGARAAGVLGHAMRPVHAGVRSLSGAGRLRRQSAFASLHRLAVAGLNYSALDFRRSGQQRALDYIRSKVGEPEEPVTVFVVGGAGGAGEYAQAVLRRFGGAATLHCFEPSPSAFAALKGSLPERGFVRVHPFGFGDHDEGAPRRVDDFCAANAIERVHLLRVDSGGTEFTVLKGARGLLEAGAVDYVQFAFGERDIATRTFFRDFFDLLIPRYRLYRIVRNGLFPIDAYSPHHEIFVDTAHFLAIRR